MRSVSQSQKSVNTGKSERSEKTRRSERVEKKKVEENNEEKPPEETLETTPLEKRLVEAFEVFDNSKSRQVDVRELGTIIRSLGCVISEAELQEIQVEVEDVENNCVPLYRFCEYMSQAIKDQRYKPSDPENLLKAFQLLDPDNKGFILRNDLEKAITEMGEPFNAQEVEEMMSAACDLKTNKINYEHYINLLIPKLPPEKDAYAIFAYQETLENLTSITSKPSLNLSRKGI